MDGDQGLRRRLREAFPDAAAHPAMRQRVIAALADAGPAPRRALRLAAGGATAALAVALGTALLLTHAGSGDVVPISTPTVAGSPNGALLVTTRLDFSCALPVLLGTRLATVHLPDGAITTYPGSAGPASQAAFVGGRWVPADAADVSPDGRSFVYTTYTSGVPGQADGSQILVRDVATGRDREVWRGSGYVEVGAWTASGIYFVLQPQGDGLGLTEVRLLDPSHPGSTRRIGPNPPLSTSVPPGQLPLFTGSHLVFGGALWTTFEDRAPGAGPPNHVARMDLATGRITTWYTSPPNLGAIILGLDAQGHPVLSLLPPDVRITGPTAPPTPSGMLVLLTAPDQTVTLAGGDLGQYWTSAVGDDHGIWITSEDGLWLYRGGRLERVGTTANGTIPAAGFGLRVVGGCL
jgi:hypothetical protein